MLTAHNNKPYYDDEEDDSNGEKKKGVLHTEQLKTNFKGDGAKAENKLLSSPGQKNNQNL